jgi:flagellar export protein FliJ
MNAFKFSLQALLTLREQQEQAALQVYGKALTAQERAVGLLESTLEELDEAQTQFQNRLIHGCPAIEIVQLHSWRDAIEQRLMECEHAAKSARNLARLAFVKLLAARHATAILVKLRDEQKRRHHRAQRRHEQKLLDDLASRRNALAMMMQFQNQAIWN